MWQRNTKKEKKKRKKKGFHTGAQLLLTFAFPRVRERMFRSPFRTTISNDEEKGRKKEREEVIIHRKSSRTPYARFFHDHIFIDSFILILISIYLFVVRIVNKAPCICFTSFEIFVRFVLNSRSLQISLNDACACESPPPSSALAQTEGY